MSEPQTLIDLLLLISQVRILNSRINGGRGASVLRSVITHLERDDFESAKAVLLTDRDKLWQYDEEHHCISFLERLGLLPQRSFWEGSGQPTPWDLLRVEAIRKFAAENPREAGHVLDQVIQYLEGGDEGSARYKVKLDTDKFLDRKKVLAFFNSIELLDDEYKDRMIKAGVIS